MYKKILSFITAIFLILLMFLTFFSRTLADMQLPSVSLAFASSGTIRPEAVSSGILTHENTETIFASFNGRITQILSQGDDIGRTTILFVIESDFSTINEQLVQEDFALRSANLNIDRVRSELSTERTRLDQLLDEPLPKIDQTVTLAFETRLEANNIEMQRAVDNLAVQESLHEAGIVAKQDVIAAENAIINLEQAREQIYFDIEQALIREQARIENEVLKINDDIARQRDRVTSLNFQLRGLEIDAARIQNRIENLNRQLGLDGIVEVKLPEDMPSRQRVKTVLVNIGATVQEGTPILETYILDDRFTLEVSFPQVLDFITAGQEVDLTVGRATYSGRTTQITPAGGRNDVTISLESKDLKGGEMAQIRIFDNLSNHNHVVPLSAVREDDIGHFIYFIEAEEGRIGSQYFVKAQQVEVVRSDTRNAAIAPMFFGTSITEFPIIINSDMPVSPGNRVRPADTIEFTPLR